VSKSYDAVLLVGFGAPTRPDEIRPFLDNLLRGRPVPRERYEEVVRHYEHLGGRSPYNKLTMRQAAALGRELRRGGIEMPVFVGMRNWNPYLTDVVRKMSEQGVKRAVGFILAAHRCEASFDRYVESVRAACETVGASAPEVEFVGPWHDNALFIEAVTARAREAFAHLEQREIASAHLIFTAHSIPVAMASASPYVEQITESARMVASELGYKSWTLAFQSRSGQLREPWLEPDISDALRKLDRGATAIVIPIGFLCDHIEVLYDLDVDAARVAGEAGVRMVRAGTVGDHPAFVRMMASVIRRHVDR
jgi:protoporphyrin/coproporphyrin ferrochelatase